MQDMKRDLILAAESYIAETEAKLRRTDKKCHNLTADESKGIEEIRNRKDTVVFQTDKTVKVVIYCIYQEFAAYNIF